MKKIPLILFTLSFLGSFAETKPVITSTTSIHSNTQKQPTVSPIEPIVTSTVSVIPDNRDFQIDLIVVFNDEAIVAALTNEIIEPVKINLQHFLINCNIEAAIFNNTAFGRRINSHILQGYTRP